MTTTTGVASAEGFSGTAPDNLAFEVLRDGSPIGHHKVNFEQVGEELHVDVDIQLEVNLAFITLYRYEHQAKEVWRDGRLVSLESTTNDDGDRFEVSAELTSEGLVVEGAEGRFIAPSDIIPTTYWRPETVEQNVLLDTQYGRLLSVSATPKGTDLLDRASEQLPAKRFALDGDLELDLWYDPTGDWTKIAFSVHGSDFYYVPAEPQPNAIIGQQSSERQPLYR